MRRPFYGVGNLVANIPMVNNLKAGCGGGIVWGKM